MSKRALQLQKRTSGDCVPFWVEMSWNIVNPGWISPHFIDREGYQMSSSSPHFIVMQIRGPMATSAPKFPCKSPIHKIPYQSKNPPYQFPIKSLSVWGFLADFPNRWKIMWGFSPIFPSKIPIIPSKIPIILYKIPVFHPVAEPTGGFPRSTRSTLVPTMTKSASKLLASRAPVAPFFL